MSMDMRQKTLNSDRSTISSCKLRREFNYYSGINSLKLKCFMHVRSNHWRVSFPSHVTGMTRSFMARR